MFQNGRKSGTRSEASQVIAASASFSKKLKAMGNTQDSISQIWGERAPYFETWSDRIDERTIGVADRWIQSACVLCSNGCGIEIGVKDGRIVRVRGSPDDHVNPGRLRPKGLRGS